MSEGPQEVQPEKSKAELFAENPDRFVDLAEIVFAVFRDPETGEVNKTLPQCRSIQETYIAEGYTRDSLALYRAALREKSKASRIVPANGKNPGFIAGLRNMGRNGR